MTKTANLACSGNTEKKPPGDGHPSGAYFVLTWKYLLSWLSLVYARAFFLSSFVCVLSRASGRLCKAFYSSLVFKVGGWGKIPQNQRQGHFWAFYFYMRFKMAAAGAIFLFLRMFLYLARNIMYLIIFLLTYFYCPVMIFLRWCFYGFAKSTNES